MTSRIRVLIVDDEPLARDGIATLLAGDPEIEVVGTSGDGQSATAAIRTLRPDLVFLDVQMPKRDGFAALVGLKPEERPAVVFVTAYNQYAMQAFEVCAVDYLLKPFSDARFAATLARAKESIRRSQVADMGRKMDELLRYVQAIATGAQPGASPAAPAPAAEAGDRVILKTGSDIHFVRAADIIWIESQADFVKVHTTTGAQLVRETLQNMEQRVDPAKFLRIHRSSLVNLDHVRKVTPALYGDYTVLLSNDAKLRLSRGNRGKLKQLIARLSSSPDATG